MNVQFAEQPTVGKVLLAICRDPLAHLVYRWNWKAAVLSPAFRSLVFFFSNLSAGWRPALAAALFELLYRAPAAGVFGALTQSFRNVTPPWAASLTVMFLLPTLAHGLEYLLHMARGTPRLGTSIIASVCFTVLSTLFNLFVMRRGAFVTGTDGQSILSDFRRVPKLLLEFIMVPPTYLRSRFQVLLEYLRPSLNSETEPEA